MAAVRSVMTTTRTHFLLLHNNKCSSSGCYFLRLNKAFASLCRWPSPKEKSSSSSAEETLARRIASRGGSISSSSKEFSTREEGQPESLEYRIFFSDRTGRTISPWHDIPLRSSSGEDGDGTLLNFVVEIPKRTKAKMEVATEEQPYTPIKQDTKNGKLRYYPQIHCCAQLFFSRYNINWNYGLLPQTWEDPTHSNPDIENTYGDNDPVDIVEIGERQAEVGEVLKVKPLGIFAMIDEGELDWKVVAISVDDQKAYLVDDIDDVEIYFPGTLTAIHDWFQDYKVPDGSPPNRFGLGDKPADKATALRVIAETNAAWANLVKRHDPGEINQLKPHAET
ncbi:unnamed protein product [Sphagnum jensenii]|uniref:inorganic diphosphatase n=1 Tax=Sphagnum jensenii TaxID=128206 RepID=A0ABP0WN35_9BRYO